MTATTPTDRIGHQQPGGLMDITAVAARLGVSVRHVRRLVHERRIPYIKWGHLIRFDSNDIERWIDDARKDTGPDCDTPSRPIGAAHPPVPARRS